MASSEATHTMFYVREINPALGVEVHQIMAIVPEYKAKYYKKVNQCSWQLKKILSRLEQTFHYARRRKDNILTFRNLLSEACGSMMEEFNHPVGVFSVELTDEDTQVEVRFKDELLITFS